MSYSGKRKSDKSCSLKLLYENIKHLEESFDESTSDEDFLKLEDLKSKVKCIEDEKLKREIIGSKEKWVEDGERSSKYLFGLEKNNQIKKHMRRLQIGDTMTSDQKLISPEQKRFYTSLFSTRQSKDFSIPDFFFDSGNIHHLTETQKLSCERAF